MAFARVDGLCMSRLRLPAWEGTASSVRSTEYAREGAWQDRGEIYLYELSHLGIPQSDTECLLHGLVCVHGESEGMKKRKSKCGAKGKDTKLGVAGKERTTAVRAANGVASLRETATATNAIRPLQQRRPSTCIHCDIQLIQRCDDPVPSCQSFRVASTPQHLVRYSGNLALTHTVISSVACMPTAVHLEWARSRASVCWPGNW